MSADPVTPGSPSDLRSYRLRNGLKQVALAGMVGVDQATVSRWERGQAPIDERAWRTLQALEERQAGNTAQTGRISDADLDDHWPALLRFYRSTRSLSQEALSELLDYAPDSVSRWERELFKPDFVAQRKLRDLILAPLDNESMVRRLIERVRWSPNRVCINWGPFRLVSSRRLSSHYAKHGHDVQAMTDITEIYGGKLFPWYDQMQQAGFFKGEAPLTVGYYQISETDARKMVVLPALLQDGFAVSVVLQRPWDFSRDGKTDGDFRVLHGDMLVG
ncbi:MAG: helix-turn-helix transcriptional regulator [Pseudomonadota bacterium]